MLEHMLGLEVFNEGVVNYLKEYNLDNAERTDLWAELNAVAHENGVLDGDLDLGVIMEGWTTKAGYPVITVSGVAVSYTHLTLPTIYAV